MSGRQPVDQARRSYGEKMYRLEQRLRLILAESSVYVNKDYYYTLGFRQDSAKTPPTNHGIFDWLLGLLSSSRTSLTVATHQSRNSFLTSLWLYYPHLVQKAIFTFSYDERSNPFLSKKRARSVWRSIAVALCCPIPPALQKWTTNTSAL